MHFSLLSEECFIQKGASLVVVPSCRKFASSLCFQGSVSKSSLIVSDLHVLLCQWWFCLHICSGIFIVFLICIVSHLSLEKSRIYIFNKFFVVHFGSSEHFTLVPKHNNHKAGLYSPQVAAVDLRPPISCKGAKDFPPMISVIGCYNSN